MDPRTASKDSARLEETLGSEGEFEANPDYADFYRRKGEEDDPHSTLFRLEGPGIVVYDSKARYSDSERGYVQAQTQTRVLTEEILKEIEKGREYGNEDVDKTKFQEGLVYPPEKYVNEEYTLVVPCNSLRFNAKFESGNLSKAIRISEDEYELRLEYDWETKGFTQWYYFAATTYKPCHRVRFSITNLMKYESLYNNGLQPLVKTASQPWHRSGSHIAYYKNTYPRANPNHDPRLPTHYYTLTFTYVFDAPGQEVRFAHCYPYTYTDLKLDLERIQADKWLSDRVRIDTLCKSLAGNDCFLVTITDRVQTYMPWAEEETLMLKTAAGRRLIRQRISKQMGNTGKSSAS